MTGGPPKAFLRREGTRYACLKRKAEDGLLSSYPGTEHERKQSTYLSGVVESSDVEL